jgi:hypothetical protein
MFGLYAAAASLIDMRNLYVLGLMIYEEDPSRFYRLLVIPTKIHSNICTPKDSQRPK